MSGFPAAAAIRDHFTLDGQYIAALRTGRKSTTIRWRQGALDLPRSDVLPLYVAGEPAGQVRIRSVAFRRWEHVGNAEAWRDGFPDARSMRAALETIYPELARDDWVTIYAIELLGREAP